ncbi:MAG: hypothetical protein V4692_10505, partial [Bdellovibrionota bacterium]
MRFFINFVLLFASVASFAQGNPPESIEPATQSSEASKADELKPPGSVPAAHTEAKGLPQAEVPPISEENPTPAQAPAPI